MSEMDKVLTDICKGLRHKELTEMCMKVIEAKPLDETERAMLSFVFATVFALRGVLPLSGNVDAEVAGAAKEALRIVNRHPTEEKA